MKQRQRHTRNTVLGMIVIILIIILLVIVEENRNYIAFQYRVNLRVQPTKENKPFYVEIPQDKEVESYLTLEDKGFVLVGYEGYVGFVPTEFACKTKKSSKLIIGYAGEGTNLKEQPYNSSTVLLENIPSGTPVIVYDVNVETDDNYYLCVYNGIYGFVTESSITLQ